MQRNRGSAFGWTVVAVGVLVVAATVGGILLGRVATPKTPPPKKTAFVLTPEERELRDTAAAQTIVSKAVEDVSEKGILTGKAFFAMSYKQKSDALFAVHNALLPAPDDANKTLNVLSNMSGKPIGVYDREKGLRLY